MNKKQPTSPPFDLSNIKYCEIHESHWISKEGVEENCPWCQRDKLEDQINWQKHLDNAFKLF